MLFGLFTKNKHIETEEEKQYLKKHDRDAQP